MANIRNSDLNLLIAFDAIFDELSVTRAAERLAVTQPTASGMLRRLRETFGDELFVRTSHGLIPTPRAENLAGPVKSLLHDADAILSPANFDPARAEETFRLSASDYMQQAVVIPTIRRLRQVSPKCRVAAMPRSPARLAGQLIRGEVDVCICAQETVIADTATAPLYLERYVCVGRKQHRFREGFLSLDRLSACDHLFVDPSGRSFIGPVDKALAQAGRARRVAVALPTFSDLFRLLLSEDFLAFVPERLVEPMQTNLKVFNTELEIPEFEVVAMWHPRFDNEARHAWLRGLLVEVATIQAPIRPL